MENYQTINRQLWAVATGTAIVIYLVMTLTLLEGENDPNARKVREAVYGDRPVGLPWLAVHAAICAGILAPLPACIVNSIRVFWAASDLGAGKRGPLLWRFFSSYCATAFIPELQRARFWMKVTWGWFFAVFVGWIVLTTILDV
jgi:hypothetical protein